MEPVTVMICVGSAWLVSTVVISAAAFVSTRQRQMGSGFGPFG